MSNSYEEFVVEYMGGSIKDYAMDKILEAVQDYLVDKGFGRDLVESSILYVTNGGQGVDFSKYLDVDKNSKFAQTLATIDIAKCYSCLATITDFSNHIQNLYHGLEELDSSDLDSYERDINLKNLLSSFLDFASDLVEIVPGGFAYAIAFSEISVALMDVIDLGLRYYNATEVLQLLIDCPPILNQDRWYILTISTSSYEDGPSLEELELYYNKYGNNPNINALKPYLEWRIQYEFEMTLLKATPHN